MAMSFSASAEFALTDGEVLSSTRNDAFSFWKLPEDWRSELKSQIDSSETVAQTYLLEQYLDDCERRPPKLMRAYYPFKRLIPREVRYYLNSLVIRSRSKRSFPHWPCESELIDFWRTWLSRSLEAVGVKDGWHIGFWPGGAKCSIVLTHDVESPMGFDRMKRMADLEESYGFRSAWNLPLAQYPIDWKVVEELRSRGFEFGAHGLCHDGRLFRNRKIFDELAPTIERIAAEHDMRGFRAPSTLRRAEWIASMAFDHDSSFSDTDPYEPQAGGTCSIFPFFLQNMIELPYTLAQDHTLIEVLKRDPLPVWVTKAHWIASLGGMVLALTHPDYIGASPYLEKYEELLKHLQAIENSWRALPSEVSAWWRARAKLQLETGGNEPHIFRTDGNRSAAAAKPMRLSEEPLAR